MSASAPHPHTKQTTDQPNLWFEWLQRASKELKLDHPESLIKTDSDGIARAPYYTSDGPFAYAKPLLPFGEDSDPSALAPAWLAVAPVGGHSPSDINTRALHALQHGGEALLLDGSGLLPEHLAESLQGILPQFAPLFFRGVNAGVLFDGFAYWMRQGHIDPQHIQGALLCDAVDLLVMDERQWTKIEDQFAFDVPNFNPLGVDTADWRAWGLSAPQELALSWLCVYRRLSIHAHQTSKDSGHSKPGLPLYLSVGCTTEFFNELALLRALRAGIDRVASLFSEPNDAGSNFRFEPQILVRIPKECLPSEDPHTNLLRLTTMGVSSVLGGCTALSLPPFDPQNQDNGDYFADELSLQMQMILRHEAFPRLPLDAGAGSGYIEHLSRSFGERAWSIFGELVALCTPDNTWNATALRSVLNEWCLQGKALEQEMRNSGRRIRVGVDRYRIDGLNPMNPSAS
jgi:methylmalonyl-CoA mutase